MRQTSLKTGILIVSLALSAGVLSVSSAFADGGIGGRVVNHDKNNPEGSSIFSYKLKPGQTKTDQLEVINNSDKKQTILLGSVDGVAANNGSIACRSETEQVVGSGSWTKLSTDKVVLEAGKSKKIDFTVTVPKKVDVGEHNSCLTMQADNQQFDSNASGIQLTMRQAIRMAITIPGDLKRELTIEKLKVNNTTSSPQYEMTVKNSGNVSSNVEMNISLKNIFNQSVDEISNEYPILPDVALTQNFTTEFRPMFGGIFEATPSISYDTRIGIFGVENTSEKLETKTGQSVTFILMPTVTGWLIIIGALGALVAAIWMIVSKLKSRKLLRENLVGYKVKPSDSIQSIAEKYDANWRDIAHINKISAPYSVKPGETLQVPSKKPNK